jgi:diketogulonate reductase-like aldo/keto reductase
MNAQAQQHSVGRIALAYEIAESALRQIAKRHGLDYYDLYQAEKVAAAVKSAPYSTATKRLLSNPEIVRTIQNKIDNL